MQFITLLRALRKRIRHEQPLVRVEISKSALLHNLNIYRTECNDVLVAPVLKSNAYGHGLLQIAQILDKENLPFFVLDSLFEAKTLRHNGIKTNLLVIGYTPVDAILSRTTSVAFTITSLDQLKELALKAKKRVRIHLKVDTGMHRQGVLVSEIEEAIQTIQNAPFLSLEGLCSHFADADGNDSKHTQEQIGTWKEVILKFEKHFASIPYIHISATAGVRYLSDAPGNVLRLGLGLYGINPLSDSPLTLKPVLSMHTVVSSVRDISIGESVGYNCTHTASQPQKIATIPVGYFEGVDRRLSNVGFFKIGTEFCPIVGRVSMNITTLDISHIPDVTRGINVTVLSNVSSDKNSVVQIAKQTGTIPWEILVHIPQHLKRVVVE